MSEPYTLAAVRTIRKNAGLVPPQTIADALGWTPNQLDRIAKKHGIDLRAQIATRDDGVKILATVKRVTMLDRHTEHFGVRLRRDDAKVLKEKAGKRFTNPSRLIAEVFEGAVARGWVDELASVSRGYRAITNGSDETP